MSTPIFRFTLNPDKILFMEFRIIIIQGSSPPPKNETDRFQSEQVGFVCSQQIRDARTGARHQSRLRLIQGCRPGTGGRSKNLAV